MNSSLFFKRNVLPGVLFLSLFMLFPSLSFALFGGKVDSYSADYVVLDKGGKVVSTTKLYVIPAAIRMDGIPSPAQGGEQQLNLSYLTLKKEGKVYVYNHDKKLVYETTEKEGEEFVSMMDSTKNSTSEKVLGKEKVSGYKCVKKEIETSFTFMGITDTSKSIVWESDRFDFPLKTQDEEGSITEMRNIKTGKPSKKLFKPIEGYKKVGSMMAVMGMDFGSMMRGSGESKSEGDSTAGADKKEDPAQEEDVKKAIEESLQGLGDSLKNFKFGN